MKKLYFALLSLFLTASSAMAAETVTVTQMSGAPELVRGGQTMPCTKGMQCKTGDVLKTPTAECGVDVSVNGLAGARVLGNSEFVIVNADQSDMHMKIASGNAIMNLKKLPQGSAFKVETPTAVAAVRGTQFWGRVNMGDVSNPITTFAVREGRVEIFDKVSQKSFSLEKGQAIDIAKDGSAAPVIRPALDEEMAAMAQASQVSNSA